MLTGGVLATMWSVSGSLLAAGVMCLLSAAFLPPSASGVASPEQTADDHPGQANRGPVSSEPTGASAIQSDAYKLVESLCRTPDETRVDSLAYRSVPGVRRMVLSGQATVSSALLRAAEVGMPDEQVCAVRLTMDDFEAALLRWRTTHYHLARRMLGDAAGGTGYTAGVPYLEQVRRLPVFEPAPPDCRNRADANGGSEQSEPDELTWSGESS